MDIPQLDLFGGDAGVVKPASLSASAAVGADGKDGADGGDIADIAAAIPSSLRLGTSSWSFPGWAGIVYDRLYTETQLARYGLRAYAQHPLLRAVGIDRSYYAPLDAAAFGAYAAVVPADFRFLVKAERLLVLPDIEDGRGGSVANGRFLDPEYATEYVVRPVIDGLGDRAGPILFQFSPMHPRRVGGVAAFAERLGEFLSALPAGPLYAVELRTPELFAKPYFDALAAVGAAHGYTVHGSMVPLERQLEMLPVAANPALVLRWMLHARHGYAEARTAYEPFNAIVDPDEPARLAIIKAALAARDEDRDAYVIVNNKAEGSSPLSVLALASLLTDHPSMRRS
jgi:uncharacterized protein YecE (DUF72 family)